MTRYFLIILISFLLSNQSLAKNIDIQENINLIFKCELEKKIIKNSDYNYEVFLAKDLDKKELKFLRLNLEHGHKCRKSFFNSKGFLPGSSEYKTCVLSKGRIND